MNVDKQQQLILLLTFSHYFMFQINSWIGWFIASNGYSWKQWLFLREMTILERNSYSWQKWLFLTENANLDRNGYSWQQWLLLTAITILGSNGYFWQQWLFLTAMAILLGCSSTCKHAWDCLIQIQAYYTYLRPWIH